MWWWLACLVVASAQEPAEPEVPPEESPTVEEPLAEPEPAEPDPTDPPPAAPAEVPLGPDGLPVWYPRPKKPVPPPTHRLWYRSATFGRINPLGLQSILDIGWRYQIIKRTGMFYNDSYFFVGPTVNASPSFMRVGLRVETMPISLLRFHAQYQFIGYLGSFDNLSSFPSRDSAHSDQTMSEAANSYLTTGGVFNLGWRFQIKIGAFALRNTSEVAMFHLNLRDGDVAFYEQYWDRLIPNGGWAIQNDLDILAAPGRTRVGLRYTYSDTLLGDGSLADQTHHRLGPVFVYEFHDRKPGARFNHPSLFFAAQWWLKHPYRTGQEQPWALPMMALGLLFDGDLIGARPER
jgi:hypothetical protein